MDRTSSKRRLRQVQGYPKVSVQRFAQVQVAAEKVNVPPPALPIREVHKAWWRTRRPQPDPLGPREEETHQEDAG